MENETFSYKTINGNVAIYSEMLESDEDASIMENACEPDGAEEEINVSYMRYLESLLIVEEEIYKFQKVSLIGRGYSIEYYQSIEIKTLKMSVVKTIWI
jgi:hypothetical protein